MALANLDIPAKSTVNVPYVCMVLANPTIWPTFMITSCYLQATHCFNTWCPGIWSPGSFFLSLQRFCL